MAAFKTNKNAAEDLIRIASGDARGPFERRLLRMAAQGKLKSTGTEQYQTAYVVFSALTGKKQVTPSLMDALEVAP